MREVVAQQARDLGDELGALFVQRVHLLGRRNRLYRINETAFHHVANALGRERLGAQRLRGGGHAFDGGLHPHIELELGVHAHAIFRDKRLFARAFDLHANRAHVDLVDLVQERQRKHPTGNDGALPAEAGADDGHVSRRLAIEAAEKDHHHRDHDDRDDDAKQPGENKHCYS